MAKWILLLLCVSLLAFWMFYPGDIRRPPGIIAPNEPIQTDIKNPMSWEFKGFTFKPMAEYAGKVRVLHVAHYTSGPESILSPVDLAFGWGAMSDQSVLDRLSISQSNRWYYFSYGANTPLPANQIYVLSANTHMIPATAAIAETLSKIRAGNVIEFSGNLVWIYGPNGFHWESSLSRYDTGGGACEVLWVKSLTVR